MEQGSCEKKTTYYYSCSCGEKGETVFEGDFAHDFTQKVTTHKYFAQESTDTQLAVAELAELMMA